MPGKGTAGKAAWPEDLEDWLRFCFSLFRESYAMPDSTVPRPFLKWAGGQARLVEELVQRTPASFGAYFEPFVGSGVLFFRLLRQGLPAGTHLSDSNAELIITAHAPA
jgi:DNA adenine methylase